MKLWSFILIIFMLYEQNNNPHSSGYKISKIDSTGNYYIIYAKKSDSIYKLISKKVETIGCLRIKVGDDYNFDLHSIWTEPIIIGNLNVSPSVTPHVNWWQMDSISIICLEREMGINDIFDTKNLKGLCYIKD